MRSIHAGPRPGTGLAPLALAAAWVVLASTLLPQPLAAQAPALYLGQQWSAGAYGFPHALAAGHLNGDGLLDLVTTGGLAVSGPDPFTSAVLLANAPGGFAAPVSYPSVGEARDVLLADVNGDGDLDLVTAVGTTSLLEIRLGNGFGGFGSASTLTAVPGDDVGSVCAADLDGDGDADLACTNALSSQLSVFLNTGGGAFAAPSHSTTGAKPVAVRSADMNGDTLADLVTLNETGQSLSVFGGGGDGTLVSHDLYVFALPIARGLCLADLDGNASPDYALTSAGTDQALVQFNDGTGVPASSLLLATGDQPRGVAAADLDLDGSLDLVTGNYNANDLSVFLGTGGGGFGPAATYPVAGQPEDVVVADIDADGLPDLAAACQVGHRVATLRNVGAGVFVAPIAVPVAVESLQDVAAGDLDGDGRPDFAATHLLAGEISVRLGDGAGGFPGGSSIPCTGFPKRLALADVTGDGALDVVVGRIGGFAGGSVGLLVGTGAGTLMPPLFYGALGDTTQDVAAADLNLDGRADVATASSGNSSFVLLGTPTGLTPAPTVSHGIGSSPTCVALGDLDSDSRPDLVVGFGSIFLGVRALLGNGAGGFGSATPTFLSPASRALALGDVDADGDLDVAVAAEDEVNVILGDGAGFLEPAFSAPIGPYVSDILLADLNADGYADIATANDDASDVSVRLSMGAGVLSPELSFASHSLPQGIASADFDLDGLDDLVTANFAVPAASVLLNASGTSGVWTNLRNGLAGVAGVPLLTGTGSLLGGSSVTLTLVNAAPSASSPLLLGFLPLYAGFAGGVIVPDAFTAPGTILPMSTSLAGGAVLTSTWPLGVPPGFAFYTQFWVADAVGPSGWAASNGLLGVTP
jgi:hypothetical protein